MRAINGAQGWRRFLPPPLLSLLEVSDWWWSCRRASVPTIVPVYRARPTPGRRCPPTNTRCPHGSPAPVRRPLQTSIASALPLPSDCPPVPSSAPAIPPSLPRCDTVLSAPRSASPPGPPAHPRHNRTAPPPAVPHTLLPRSVGPPPPSVLRPLLA